MKKITVNNGQSEVIFNIPEVEKKYNAKFVGQLCLRTKDGGWQDDECGEVYYQAIPPVEGYSHYFALIRHGTSSFITSGASAVEGTITGVIANDGEVIYSRFRHDYRVSTDGSVFIDGGRDYVRGGVGGQYIKMKIVDGEWYQLEDSDTKDVE